MKLIITVDPILNKWVNTEKDWISMLRSTLNREFGMGDLDGENLVINKLPEIKTKSVKDD